MLQTTNHWKRFLGPEFCVAGGILWDFLPVAILQSYPCEGSKKTLHPRRLRAGYRWPFYEVSAHVSVLSQQITHRILVSEYGMEKCYLTCNLKVTISIRFLLNQLNYRWKSSLYDKRTLLMLTKISCWYPKRIFCPGEIPVFQTASTKLPRGNWWQ